METQEFTIAATAGPKEIAGPIIRELEQAWNAGDGAAFGRPFADHNDFVDITGTLHAGQTAEAIGAAHQGIFDSIYKGRKVTYRLTGATRIDERTILAHVSATLEAPVGPLAGTNNATITLVLQPAADGWAIRAFHNTPVMKRGG